MFESRRRNNKSDYEHEYFTIEALGSGTISFGTADSSLFDSFLDYSKNGGEWIGCLEDTSVAVESGDRVRFKMERTEGQQVISFYGSVNFNVYGNIMSLIHGDDFVGNNTLFRSAFESLFNISVLTSSPVVDASNLILPATTMASSCYDQMFNDCTSLTVAPELPATTLASYCYANMFRGCTSLITAPELPATTLASSCYYQMFQGCTSLKTAPVLPAQSTISSCYYQMFRNCKSLNHITMLATNKGARSFYNWVQSVSSTGTFVKHPNMTTNLLPLGSTSGIPSGWTVIDAEI